MFSLFYLIDRASLAVEQMDAHPDLKLVAGMMFLGAGIGCVRNALTVAGVL